MNEHNLLKTSYADSEIQAEFPALTEHIENPRAAALLLGVATYYETTPVRNEAKKILKKHGSAEMKAVLDALSKRNYVKDSALKSMIEDLEAVEAISLPLATHLYRVYMEKTLSLSTTRLRNTLANRFYELATDAEIKEAIYLGSRDRGDRLHIQPAGKLPARALPLLWEVLEEHTADIFGIAYDTDEPHELDFRAPLPSVVSLSVRGGLSRISESLKNLPNLVQLELRDMPRLTELPEFLSEFPKLFSMKLSDTGLLRLPGSLGTCPKLEEIIIAGGQLAEIEAGIADSGTLKTLNLIRVSGVRIAPEVMQMPRIAGYRKTLKDASADENSYEPAFDNLKFILDMGLTKESPSAKEAVEIWKKTKDPKKANLSELLIALTRCAHDEEHGPSSNAYYRDVLEARAPAPLREISKLVPTRLAGGPSKEVLDKLKEIQGFDVQKLTTFIQEFRGH